MSIDTKRKTDMEEIFNQLRFKIKKHVKETVLDEREDLEQEMIIKIIEKIDMMLEEDVPDFFEFIEEIDQQSQV
ncbi:hypothetical protein [Priestia aryabhattai]|uniref:hypothetical protein n=1 Tax=Priestia aryabhattai TaxID=412384 RepID=UPI0021AD9EE0|nr:hypothetical protein [Priestia aryabhattai]